MSEIDFATSLQRNRLVFIQPGLAKKPLVYSVLACIPMVLCLLYEFNLYQKYGSIYLTDQLMIAMISVLTGVGITIIWLMYRRTFRLTILDMVEIASEKQLIQYIRRSAQNLYWDSLVITDEYLQFSTPQKLDSTEIQTISILIFPGNRIMFNCMNESRQFANPNETDLYFHEFKNELHKVVQANQL